MNCPKCGRFCSHTHKSWNQTPGMETVYEGYCSVHGKVFVS